MGNCIQSESNSSQTPTGDSGETPTGDETPFDEPGQTTVDYSEIVTDVPLHLIKPLSKQETATATTAEQELCVTPICSDPSKNGLGNVKRTHMFLLSTLTERGGEETIK